MGLGEDGNAGVHGDVSAGTIGRLDYVWNSSWDEWSFRSKIQSLVKL